jgi:hypothetical protein
MSLPLQPHEKRKSPRSRARLAASIRSDDDGPAIPCVAWDMSETGAKLAVGRPLLLPDRFELVFSTAVHRRCEIMWRSEKFVGVKFVDG